MSRLATLAAILSRAHRVPSFELFYKSGCPASLPHDRFFFELATMMLPSLGGLRTATAPVLPSAVAETAAELFARAAGLATLNWLEPNL